MAKLSDLIIAHPDVIRFKQLELLVQHAGEAGQMFLAFAEIGRSSSRGRV